jgi:hypothetical protein
LALAALFDHWAGGACAVFAERCVGFGAGETVELAQEFDSVTTIWRAGAAEKAAIGLDCKAVAFGGIALAGTAGRAGAVPFAADLAHGNARLCELQGCHARNLAIKKIELDLLDNDGRLSKQRSSL